MDKRIDYELIKDRNGLEEWRVEGFDEEGRCAVAIFCGPNARDRAAMYLDAVLNAEWAEPGCTMEDD